MPSNYAHYRFGAAMLNAMPGDIRRTAKRYRRLYDVGLHGPDLFFYYDPLRQNKFGMMGRQIHRQPGREFFGRVCRSLRLDPSQAAEAYLYGALCHYALDAACHPFVVEQDRQGIADHIEIETEFDRFLLELDGKIPPEYQDLSPHLVLEPGDYAAIARFYPDTTGKAVERSVKNMARIIKLLAIRGKTKRDLMRNTLGMAGVEYRGFVMTSGPNPQCCALNEPLLKLYGRAQEQFPDLLLQLCAHLTYNAPLGADFAATFG